MIILAHHPGSLARHPGRRPKKVNRRSKYHGADGEARSARLLKLKGLGARGSFHLYILFRGGNIGLGAQDIPILIVSDSSAEWSAIRFRRLRFP